MPEQHRCCRLQLTTQVYGVDGGPTTQEFCLYLPLHLHPPLLPSRLRNQTCGDYIVRAAKVITLVDLAGHERYFRTTAYGLTGTHSLLRKAQPFNLLLRVYMWGVHVAFLQVYCIRYMLTCPVDNHAALSLIQPPVRVLDCACSVT